MRELIKNVIRYEKVKSLNFILRKMKNVNETFLSGCFELLLKISRAVKKVCVVVVLEKAFRIRLKSNLCNEFLKLKLS